ncbi:FCS-Like Zinc finger 8 [Linum grandiflorum]
MMSEYSLLSRNGKSSSVPRLFTAFKNFPETTVTESVMMSPTSILDTKPFSAFKNPFSSSSSDPNPTRKPGSSTHWDNKLDSPKIGLGLVDVLFCDDDDRKSPTHPMSKPESRMVVFGSQLKIQIPSSLLHNPNSPAGSPRSPADFGIKTRNSQLGSCSFSSSFSPSPPVPKSAVFGSPSEMELSEDYTCVISRGPNPKTTHIFDDCIVDSCCGVFTFNSSEKEASHPSESFLSSCDNCGKSLGQGKDIYMYRGEKAFCSRECRYQEMLLEEGIDEMDPLDIYGTSS